MNLKYILKGFINIVLTIVLIFLGLRLILLLFGANQGTPFVAWLYETSEPLIRPFAGIFPSPAFQQGMVLELPTVFAIFIYSLIAWLIMELIEFIHDSSTPKKKEVVREVETTEEK